MACISYSFCAKQEGSIIIPCTFKDDDDDETPKAPTSITWRLTDDNNNVINDRDSEDVTPAASINILLEGDDLPWLAVDPSDTYSVYLLISWTYNSATLGTAVSQKEQVEITVVNLAGVDD
jgi:hypothetical protein